MDLLLRFCFSLFIFFFFAFAVLDGKCASILEVLQKYLLNESGFLINKGYIPEMSVMQEKEYWVWSLQ